MLDFHQKRKIRNIMYHRVTLGVLGVFVLIILHSTWSVYKKERESEHMKSLSFDRVEELRQRKEELSSKIDKLATVSGVEEEIRSKFSVAKDNENIVVVVPEDDKKASTTVKKGGFWEKIKNFLEGK